MGICPTQPKVARILFDESHSEAWTIRRELASRCSPPIPRTPPTPSPPRRSPTATSRSCPNAERPLTRETLAAADVLVIAHPSDPKWEATTNARAPRLSDRELDAIEEFVRGGGGLIALGETEQAKYGNNLNDLLARFGIEVANCTVQDYEHHLLGSVLGAGRARERLRRRARERSTSSPGSTRPASTAPAPWRSTTAAA